MGEEEVEEGLKPVLSWLCGCSEGAKWVRPQHGPLAGKFGHGDKADQSGENAIKRWNLTFFSLLLPILPPMKCHDNTFSDFFILFYFSSAPFFFCLFVKGRERVEQKLFISPTFVCTFNLHIKEIPSGPALHIYI